MSRGALVVRLRNWVGDVTLAVPTLQRLADQGYELHLVGKGWARELLAGQGWPVHPLPGTLRERVALLRRLGRDTGAARQAGLNALCLPDSFSSALEFRLAGLRALGQAYEARSWLLGRALPLRKDLHALEVYWRFADALLGLPAALPSRIDLRISARHRAAAEALRTAHGLTGRFVLICPFAGGTWAGQPKTWPGFAAYAAGPLKTYGLPIAVCPGPGAETAEAERDFPGVIRLDRVDLGTYAALLQTATLMVANDTGPGHMAAAVGCPLVSVLGPSDPAMWRPWGPQVEVVQAAASAPPDAGAAAVWPSAEAVDAAVARTLARA